MTHYLIRYAEIALKGKNRHIFEAQLVRNMRSTAELFDRPLEEVRKQYGRIIVTGEDLEPLQLVFGLTNISPAVRCEKDIERIKTASLELAKRHKSGTISIHTQRMDKSFPFKSPDISRIIATHIEDHTELQGQLKNADHTLGVEIATDAAYIFTEKWPGFGGLPVGSGGKVSAEIHNDADILASLLVLKRGVKVIINAHTVNEEDAQLLQAYGAVFFNRKHPYELSSQTLKKLNNYTPNTLYPLIAHTEEQIQNELTDYRNVYTRVRHKN